MPAVTGIHHITCIAGDAQENVDFYSGVLGMRLVKRSVNQDSPGTYHLFYADADGHPGTDLTFFPWPEMARARAGSGLAMEVVLAVPLASLTFWERRLSENGVAVTAGERRGNPTLSFTDPHGLPVTLHETSDAREFTPWRDGPVATEHQVRGLHSVRLWERELGTTASFLTEVLGFTEAARDGEWRAFSLGDLRSGTFLEIKEIPDAKRGAWGTGGIHHVAWRVPDEKTELEVRSRIAEARRRPTEVIDRFWFKSVYFLEPGGVLFELATDGPGFAVDEDVATLGEKLVLPPWLEPNRAEIEAALPPLRAAESSAPR